MLPGWQSATASVGALIDGKDGTGTLDPRQAGRPCPRLTHASPKGVLGCSTAVAGYSVTCQMADMFMNVCLPVKSRLQGAVPVGGEAPKQDPLHFQLLQIHTLHGAGTGARDAGSAHASLHAAQAAKQLRPQGRTKLLGPPYSKIKTITGAQRSTAASAPSPTTIQLRMHPVLRHAAWYRGKRIGTAVWTWYCDKHTPGTAASGASTPPAATPGRACPGGRPHTCGVT